MSVANKIEEKICLDCEISISHRSKSTKRCEECALKIKKIQDENCHQRHKQERIIARMQIPRNCVDCNECIQHLDRRTKRCKECAIIRKLEVKRLNAKKSYHKKALFLKNSEEKFCLDCNTCIKGTHGRTKCCKDCYEIRFREEERIRYNKERDAKLEKEPMICADCKKDISNRHGRSIRCKKCSKEAQKLHLKIRTDRYREDPDYKKMQANYAKNKRKELCSTPEGLEKYKIQKMKSRIEARSTPEGRKKINEQNRQWRIKCKSTTKSAGKNRVRVKLSKKQIEDSDLFPSKQEMFNRQHGKCPYTRISMHGIPINKLHTDHIIPLARGGQNTPDNLCLTFPCVNMSKGSKYLLVWMASPLYKPVVERCIHGDVF